MPDYEPIDLSKWCNSGVSQLGGNETPALGRQSMYGIPFQVGAEAGPDSGSCYVVVGGSDDSVTIPIDLSARRIIVAHRVLETTGTEFGRPGLPIAEYVFRFRDGAEERVPIREGFEINAYPPSGPPAVPPHSTFGVPYLLLTYLALSDPDRLYYLWTYSVPREGRKIESLEIVPKGPRFLVAAVTVGLLDEDPFPRLARRLVGVTLTDSTEPSPELKLQLDRGVHTPLFPLPKAPADEFLDDPFKGWGQDRNPDAGPAYAEVSATPSATLTLSRGEEVVGNARWGEIEAEGKVETPRATFQLLDRGKNWVRVRVLDDETGRPVPCRVHFRSPEGVPYQPYGHHNHLDRDPERMEVGRDGDLHLGQVPYAYIDGRCQGWLPRGEVIVDVARGFEYEPLRQKITIEPGQRELTLRLRRWIDMNSQRWFSGDSHVHFLSTQGAFVESQGEDLNVVNLLQSQWVSQFTNTVDFTGSPNVSRDGDTIVYTSQENRQHFLGHLVMWGLKESVMPWCTDGPGPAEVGGGMESTLSHWADATHAQGGYVIKPHFPSRRTELNALIATDRLDGVELLWQTKFNHGEYYRYLNCGYRLPLVGGTDKMSTEVPVGLYRTYARLRDDEEFTYENWCKNVARGRTTLSGGPIVHLSVDGKEIGDTVQLSGAGTVEVEAWAESIIPINTLQIIQAGNVVASTESKKATRRLEIREKLLVSGNTWIAARCGGPGYVNEAQTWDGQELRHHDEWRRGVFAHTSPIYVAVGGEWDMFDPDTARYMLTMIDGSMQYIRETAVMERPGKVTHHHGEDDHLAYLQRPFLEAHQAIHDRALTLGLKL